jgi:hypothetical protein
MNVIKAYGGNKGIDPLTLNLDVKQKGKIVPTHTTNFNRLSACTVPHILNWMEISNQRHALVDLP